MYLIVIKVLIKAKILHNQSLKSRLRASKSEDIEKKTDKNKQTEDSIHVNKVGEKTNKQKPIKNNKNLPAAGSVLAADRNSRIEGLQMQARRLPAGGANSPAHSHPCLHCSYDYCPWRRPGRRTRAKGPPLSRGIRCLP